MDIKNNKSTRKIAVIIASILLVFATVLTIMVFSMRNGANESEYSSKYVSDSNASSAAPEQESSIYEASLVFNESIPFSEAESSNVSEEDSVTLFEHGWVINEFGYTYIYGDCGYEQFNYKATALERYVNCLNNLAVSIPEDTRIFSITAPVSSTFAEIPRDIYTNDNFYNQSQSAFVSTVASRIDKRITSVSVVTSLEEQYDNGEYVFFRTDKNWTALAAYNVYIKYSENAGLTPYSLENFAKKDVGEYLGCFYNATKTPAMQDNPDTLICYSTVPSVKTALTVYDSGMVYTEYELCNNKVSYSNAYNVFLGRTAGRYELSTTANGGSLLIIGDSSSYPLISFLASHYSKIDLIDPRLFDVSAQQFFSEHQYDDCIVICYSTNAVSGDYIPSLNKFFGANNE